LTDHLGSTSTTANEDGSWNSTIKYTAFGDTRESSGITPTKYRYTGQLLEAEVGLYYYVARWYDPVTMHFTQADTIVQGFSFALSYNRYSYVLYNPINANDPSGYLACSDDGYCGSLGSVGYQRHIYTEAITEVYDWTLEGKWQLEELKYIYQAGYAIETYVNQVTDSDKGLSWMNKYMGGVTFTHDSLVKRILQIPHLHYLETKSFLLTVGKKGEIP
jgi:RHS repeat-associated protein